MSSNSEINDLYNDFPVGEMNAAVSRALPVIESGGVVVLSGMCGTHKTLGFLSRLAYSLDKTNTNLTLPWDDLDLTDATKPIPEAVQPRLFDEATPLARKEGGAARIADAMESGAIVCAGLSKISRDEARINITHAFEERGRQILDLGDIATATVDSTRATTLLRKLGFDKRYIEFIEEHRVMRNPRFFAKLTQSMNGYDKTSFDDLRRFFDATIPTETSLAGNFPEIILNVAQATSHGGRAAPRHALPHAAGYHTFQEAKELYHAFDAELPGDELFDEMQAFSGGRLVDPRMKS